jgi:hypothetical protein
MANPGKCTAGNHLWVPLLAAVVIVHATAALAHSRHGKSTSHRGENAPVNMIMPVENRGTLKPSESGTPDHEPADLKSLEVKDQEIKNRNIEGPDTKSQDIRGRDIRGQDVRGQDGKAPDSHFAPANSETDRLDSRNTTPIDARITVQSPLFSARLDSRERPKTPVKIGIGIKPNATLLNRGHEYSTGQREVRNAVGVPVVVLNHPDRGRETMTGQEPGFKGPLANGQAPEKSAALEKSAKLAEPETVRPGTPVAKPLGPAVLNRSAIGGAMVVRPHFATSAISGTPKSPTGAIDGTMIRSKH